MDLEAEEAQETRDICAEGVEPITRILEYIPPSKGKVKVMKEPNLEKFTISTTLLPE